MELAILMYKKKDQNSMEEVQGHHNFWQSNKQLSGDLRAL